MSRLRSPAIASRWYNTFNSQKGMLKNSSQTIELSVEISTERKEKPLSISRKYKSFYSARIQAGRKYKSFNPARIPAPGWSVKVRK